MDLVIPSPDPRPQVETSEIILGGSAQVLITLMPLGFSSQRAVFDINVKPWQRFDRNRFNEASADISQEVSEAREERNRLHYELLFQDGSRASSREMMTEPDGKTLALETLGGGGNTWHGWHHRHRLWPWPLTDTVTIVCEWQDFGVPHTVTSVDASIFTSAHHIGT